MIGQRSSLFIAIVMFSTVSLFAQGERKPEFFVGYSNLQAEGLRSFFSNDFRGHRATLHGGNLEATLFLSEQFGVTGDLSFNRKKTSVDFPGESDSERTSIAYFMGGPSYVFSNPGRFEPFARILIGFAHTGYKASTKQDVSSGTITNSFGSGNTSFAMAFGGGLDVKFGDTLKVRVLQIDYAPIYLGDHAIAVLGQTGLQPVTLRGHRQDNIRLSFGVSF